MAIHEPVRSIIGNTALIDIQWPNQNKEVDIIVTRESTEAEELLAPGGNPVEAMRGTAKGYRFRRAVPENTGGERRGVPRVRDAEIGRLAGEPEPDDGREMARKLIGQTPGTGRLNHAVIKSK